MEAGLFFLPAHLGERSGNGNLVGLQGEMGWDYHIYEGFKDNMGKFPP